MARKTKKSEMFTVKEVVILLIMTCVANITIFFFMSSSNVSNKKIEYDDSIKEVIDAYNYIKENYYGDIDYQSLVNGAIKGMTDSLGDDYSTFIDDSDSDTYDILLKGEYIGVGIQITQILGDDKIIVSTVFENSPAHAAGILIGDVIKSINGVSCDTMTVSEVGNYIKDGLVSKFELLIERNNEEKIIFVERGSILIDSVYSEIIENNSKKVGYINMNVFALNTDEQFRNHLMKLENAGMNSLIIDVRGNTGGHLSTVTNIISEFLDGSNIIYQTRSNTENDIVYSFGDETKKYEIVLLADGVSASASEVLIAALKESYGAKVVGETTFGKGTVQEMQQITSTGENYKITTKKWLTPLGNWINEVGIKPDYEVPLSDAYYSNPIRENDNQLIEALNLLK